MKDLTDKFNIQYNYQNIKRININNDVIIKNVLPSERHNFNLNKSSFNELFANSVCIFNLILIDKNKRYHYCYHFIILLYMQMKMVG